MLIPTLKVDADTLVTFRNYIDEWAAYFDKGLADYNMSQTEPLPEWYKRLEFSNTQRKFALNCIITGLTNNSASNSDTEGIK